VTKLNFGYLMHLVGCLYEDYHDAQSLEHNLNNVQHVASRNVRNKKKEYLQAKIDGLETNSKINYIRLV
jgi:hypothetical protein